MNLTWHIVKKDLRCLRLPALLWAVLLAGQVYVSNALLSPLSYDLNWFFQMGMFFNLLVVVGLVVTYILVAMLVLEDPLSGTTMFWVTRPITGGRLLGAKLLVAFLLFGLLPLLFWLPWWLYCSFGVADLVRAAGFVLAVQAIAVLPAFVIAALVDQIGRFLLFSLLLVFALLVVALNLAVLGSNTDPGFARELQELRVSRLLVAGALLLLFGLIVIWRQYFSRKVVSASVVLVAGVLASVATVFWSPLNLSSLWAEHQAPLAGAGLITGEIHSARMSSFKDNEGVEIDTVVIELRFTGGQEDVSVADGLADVELRWPDGVSIRQTQLKTTNSSGVYWAGIIGSGLPLRRILDLKPDEERWFNHWDPATHARQTALRAEMLQRLEKHGQPVPGWEPKDAPEFAALYLTLPLTAAQAARIKADPPACSISARIGAQKPEVLIEMPFKGGTRMAHNGERLHILGMARVQRTAREGPPLPGWCMTTAVSAMAPGFRNDVHLYRVDRNRGVLSYLAAGTTFSAMPLAANIACVPFGFEPPQLWRGEKWVEEPGWEESATLVSVTYLDAGGFDRNFHTDRLMTINPDGDETVK